MDVSSLLISLDDGVATALRRMDESGAKMLVVVDASRKLVGVVTDGDIRRLIIKSGGIDSLMSSCVNREPKVVPEDYDLQVVQQIMTKNKIGAVPVVDRAGILVDVLMWDAVFAEGRKQRSRQPTKSRSIDTPVVVMAGGKGTRLDPFTRILPKPLMPIGEKTVLEMIINRFKRFGVKSYQLVINYKAEMIVAYMDNTDLGVKVEYIREREFLGTAGGLGLQPERLPETFFVTNCDIIVDADFAEVDAYHRKRGNIITMVGSLQRHIVPYGVIDFSANGTVERLREKPEFDFTINTGVYVLQKEALNYLPKGEFFHITDLITECIKAGRRVGVFPVSEKSYIDIGQWDEYRKNKQLILADDE